jgi:hypothetical protein
MKSKSFEDVLREHLLKKPETEETSTPQQNNVNIVDALQPLAAAGAENDAARSVFQGEGEEDDDTNNAARAAK